MSGCSLPFARFLDISTFFAYFLYHQVLNPALVKSTSTTAHTVLHTRSASTPGCLFLYRFFSSVTSLPPPYFWIRPILLPIPRRSRQIKARSVFLLLLLLLLGGTFPLFISLFAFFRCVYKLPYFLKKILFYLAINFRGVFKSCNFFLSKKHLSVFSTPLNTRL